MRTTINHARAARRALALVLLAACLGAGCGQPPALAEVEGAVTDPNGKPVPFIRVVFCPDFESGTIGPESSGVTGYDGRFRLKTEDMKGATPGRHRVCLSDMTALNAPSKSRIPHEYTMTSTTPLRSADVQAGQAPMSFAVPVIEQKGLLLPPLPPGLPPEVVEKLLREAKETEAATK